MRGALFGIVLFFMCLHLEAKDLYLTVRSDFAPTENPVIEMTYIKPGPVTLRILKPKDLKKFISEQIDLRRAWKAPRSQYNTARALVMGLNSMHMDVDWLRYNFSENIRKSTGKQFSGGVWEAEKTKLPVGPKKLINAPEGFEVVNEFTVNPEGIDSSNAFDVPGFDWYFGSSNGQYKTREVNLPSLVNGFYVVQVIQGDQEGQVVVVVNDLRVSLQQTDATALVRVTNRAGEPLKHGKVALRNLQGDWFASSDISDGQASIKTSGQNELIALVESGESFAILDTEFYSNTSENPDVYIMTDRPMFKTTDKLYYKGIARENKSAVSEVFAAKSRAHVSLESLSGAVIAEASPTSVNEFGSFAGEIPFKNIAGDVYHLVAQIGDGAYGGDVRVKDYVKPIYFLTLKSSRDSLKPGETFQIDVKAARYAGGIPNEVKLDLELERIRYEGPEWVENAGLSESGSKENYFFDSSKAQPIIPMSVKTESDVPLTGGHKSMTFQVPKEMPGDPNFNYKLVLKVSARDSDGNRAYKSLSFAESTHDFLIQTKMSASFMNENGKAFCKVRVRSTGGGVVTGAQGKVSFTHIDYSGKRTQLKTENLLPNAQGEAQFDIPTQKTGEVTARIELTKNAKTEVETQSLLIVPDKGGASVKHVEELTLLTRRPNYSVGETAKAFVLLPEAWGVQGKNEGYLFTTLAGKDIHETKIYKVSGLSTWIDTPILKKYGSSVYLIVSYMDPKIGYVERQLAYRIIDSDKLLTVDVKPLAEVINPGAEQSIRFKVTNQKGVGKRSELSVSVVDQAVLDLQAELRPRLLDFFYPLQRLNLMTFISNEFQSYGYTETVAKLFKADSWFAATKAQEITRKEEDTAYFNGQLQTDENGNAQIKFVTPGNQTIWKVIVTALDKEGRFGEANSDFKAQTDVPIFFVATDSLRRGESFSARLLINNLSPATLHFKAHIEAGEGLKIVGAADLGGEIKSRGEFGQLVEISSDAQSKLDSSSLKLSVTYGQQTRIYNLPIKLLENSATVPVNLSWNQAGAKDLQLNDGEKVVQASLQVRSGLSGTILPALQWMIEYPHGCIEQITNTTLPSLALSKLLLHEDPNEYVAPPESLWEKVQFFFSQIYRGVASLWTHIFSPKMTPHQLELIQKAREFASQGTDKIMALQLKDGPDKGLFTWYGEQTNGDRAMTLYVLFSMLSQERLSPKVLPNIESAMERLGQEYSSDELFKFYSLFFRGRLEIHQRKRSDLPIADFNMAFENWQAKPDMLKAALWLMGIEGFSVPESVRADVESKKKTISTSTASALKELLHAPMVTDRFLGTSIARTGSLVAFVSRALHETSMLSNELKEDVRTDLMTRFNGRNFESTFETGQILTHAYWLLEEELKSSLSARKPEISIGGKSISDSGAVRSLAGYELPIDASQFNSGKSVINVNIGQGERATLLVEKSVPLDKIQAAGSVKVQMNMQKLDGVTQKLSTPDAQNPIHVGDYIYLEVQSDDNWVQNSSNYNVLSIDIPSGFEILEEDAAFANLNVTKEKAGWERRQTIKGKIYFYFSKPRNWWFYENDFRKIGIVLRAGFAGHFSTGVAKLEDMYDVKIWGQSGSLPLSVLRAE